MSEKYVLKLYITGRTAKSELAIRNLMDICENALQGLYEVSVIDILNNPELAESERIVATPLVVKELPPPIRRYIGDLSDKENVLLGLDLVPKKDVWNKEN